MTIHFVYPYDPRQIAAPWSIGNQVAAGLRAHGYDVQQYDWEDCGTIEPKLGDVLLGHPHPADGFVFRNSLHRGWGRVVALAPFNGSEANRTFAATWLDDVDHFLAICGPHWAAQLLPKSSAVDMAVDRAAYPRVTNFAEPGKRSIAYIGCTVPDKGTDVLAELSTRLDAKVYHFGYGVVGGAVVECGHHDFKRGAPVVDFVIATGRNDANPTSILEGACWGMIALCTPESGWGEDVALRLEHDDMAERVNFLLGAPTGLLEERRAVVDAALPEYSWDRFVDKVIEAIGGGDAA
jgi:hypothetical protein